MALGHLNKAQLEDILGQAGKIDGELQTHGQTTGTRLQDTYQSVVPRDVAE